MSRVDAAQQAIGQRLSDKPYCAGNLFSLADVSVGCALAYLDFRFSAIDWRTARLARLQSRTAVGLVFAGGGARGLAHLGVWRPLPPASKPGPEEAPAPVPLGMGWLMHGTRGGVCAGVLFVLPSLLILTGLSWLHMVHGQHAVVAGLFYGIKPAVTALVLQAAVRMVSRG